MTNNSKRQLSPFQEKWHSIIYYDYGICYYSCTYRDCDGRNEQNT